MRMVQVPLWWSMALGVGVFMASIDGDMAGAITFACIFGFIFGGGMQVIQKTPLRPRFAHAKKRRVKSMPYGQMMRPRKPLEEDGVKG